MMHFCTDEYCNNLTFFAIYFSKGVCPPSITGFVSKFAARAQNTSEIIYGVYLSATLPGELPVRRHSRR